MLPGPAFFAFMRFFLLLGSLDYSLSSLDLWVSSLEYRAGSLEYCEVRWFLGQFVGLLGSSLDYRFQGVPRKLDRWNRVNPEVWTPQMS